MNQVQALFCASLALLPLLSNAQDKYGSRDGEITFFSQAPLEDITAVNRKAASVFVPASGALEFSTLIKAFEFEKALMQEHFNENYMESGTFPKATFKGRLVAEEGDDLTKSGTHSVGVEGVLSIHGVEKPLSTTGTLEVTSDGKIKATSKFSVSPEDHGISIPGVVREKIAKEISISVNISYAKL